MSARCAVVTGAASGIGAAVVEGFHEAGWHVAAVDMASVPDSVPATWRFQGDVSQESTWSQIRSDLSMSRLHALVNNAAVQVCKPLADTTTADWQRIMAVNLTAPFLAVRTLLPLLGGGAVINVSSVHALASSPHIAAYAASKGGLLSLTRAMAVELGPSRIRVNAVLPGAVDTPMLRDGLQRFAADPGAAATAATRLAERTVLGRIGEPREIARMVLFLADHESSSFVTGQGFVVDGGVTARLSSE